MFAGGGRRTVGWDSYVVRFSGGLSQAFPRTSHAINRVNNSGKSRRLFRIEHQRRIPFSPSFRRRTCPPTLAAQVRPLNEPYVTLRGLFGSVGRFARSRVALDTLEH